MNAPRWAQGGKHFGGHLEIDYVHGTVFRKTQLRLWDVHKDGEPFAVEPVAAYGGGEVVLKGKIGGDAVGVGYVGQKILAGQAGQAGHDGLLSGDGSIIAYSEKFFNRESGSRTTAEANLGVTILLAYKLGFIGERENEGLCPCPPLKGLLKKGP